MQRIYRWQSDDGVGLEHLNLQHRDDLIIAEGIVIGNDEDGPFGCSYRICCDALWRVRAVEVHAAGGESRVLTTDGKGAWIDGDGAPLPALGGCMDVDISATPFTNTLPIRRLGEHLRQRTGIQVAYIAVPGLALDRTEQAYTRLGAGRYLFEGLASACQAELEVDQEGIVLRYPALFRRIAGP